METRTDAELVRQYAESGDDKPFAELVLRHRQAVYRACLRMLGDAHEAEDAAQAVFIVLHRKASGLRRDGSLSGWLHNVARKVALEAIRRRAGRAKREESFAAYAQTGDVGTGPESDNEAVLKIVDEALEELPVRLREAVILRYLQGYSQKDGAELAGCPQGTFGRRAHDGVEQLRARLAREGVPVTVASLVAMLCAESQAAAPEILLSSIGSASNTVAAGAAAGAGKTSATILAEGAMKAMTISKIQFMAIAAAGVVAIGGVSVLVAQSAGGGRAESVPTPASGESKSNTVLTKEMVTTNSPFWQFGNRMGQLSALTTRGDLDKAALSQQATTIMNEMLAWSRQIDTVYPTNWSPESVMNAVAGALVGAGLTLDDTASPALQRLCEDFKKGNEDVVTVFQYDTRTLTLRVSENIRGLASNVVDQVVRKEDREKAMSGLLQFLQPLDGEATSKTARATIRL